MFIELQAALTQLTADLEVYRATIEAPAAITRPLNVEELVRKEFNDAPVMIEVAWCESRFRQYDKNGQVLKGEVNSQDRGVFQINLDAHPHVAGLVDTAEGNIRYARHLYNTQGTRPWKFSQPCWGRAV